MTQTKRLSTPAVILVAGATGFVALGAGIAGAENLQVPVHDVSSALGELQGSVDGLEQGASDLGVVLPEFPLAGTVTKIQDITGLDKGSRETIGQSASEAMGSTAQDAGMALEGTAREAGGTLEDSASELLPPVAESVAGLYHEAPLLPELAEERLPELAESSSLSEATGLIGDNALALEDLDPLPSVTEPGGTLPLSHAGSTTVSQTTSEVPGLTDLTDALFEGDTEMIDVNGPQSEAQRTRMAEGADTTTAEGLVSELSRGTDLLGSETFPVVG